MKKLLIFGLLWMVYAGAVLPARADGVALKDKSEIVGTWMLEGTAIKRNGERTAETGKWIFGENNILSTESLWKFAAPGGQRGALTQKYEIKDGNISTEVNGTYKVLEKDDKNMILKGAFGYYFFKKG